MHKRARAVLVLLPLIDARSSPADQIYIRSVGIFRRLLRCAPASAAAPPQRLAFRFSITLSSSASSCECRQAIASFPFR
jgi:hypothetical protein